jgi:hypothetical protein
MSVQVVPLGLDCHCTPHVPIGIVGVAVKMIFAPEQRIVGGIVMDTEGPFTMVTTEFIEIKGGQFVPVELTETR